MPKIRVLIVDDSVTQREIFCRLLASDPELIVAGQARNGREALEQVQASLPDVVLMDIHMPEMDGIQATEEIMKQCPVPIVIASATLKKHDVDLAMKALEVGAVAVIEKPEGAVLLHLSKIAPELRRELIAASKARVHSLQRRVPAAIEAPPVGLSPLPREAADSRTPASVKVIGVCTSTGGPSTLLEIFSALPQPFPIPILLVQHISPHFEEGFARWLSTACGQPVRIARQGQPLTAGIWISPSGQHLIVLNRLQLGLSPGTASDLHCPSGNPLFASLAEHFGPRAVGIQLTGMGNDGAKGLLSLKQSGGLTIIQDETSSLIWGMPKAAQDAGAATCVGDPGQIAQFLKQIAHSSQHLPI